MKLHSLKLQENDFLVAAYNLVNNNLKLNRFQPHKVCLCFPIWSATGLLYGSIKLSLKRTKTDPKGVQIIRPCENATLQTLSAQ